VVSGWRIVGLATVLGLLGSGVAGLALANSAGGPSVIKHPGLGGGPLRLAGQARAAGSAGSAGSDSGLRLLQEAATACQATSYSGEQVVLWWGAGETSASVVDVWHQPGQGTLVQAATAIPGTAGRAMSGRSAGAEIPARPAPDPDPDGILGVSDQLLALLQSNYQIAYVGRGSATGRTALVVEVRKPGGGGLTARFWLDAATKLPLRREIFTSGSHMISEDSFINLELGASGLGAMPAPAAAPWSARLGSAKLTALRARGWPLPGQLPGNLVLFAATQTSARSGRVIDLSYSDGLAVISVFVQRGELGEPMPGWRQIGIRGQTVYSINPSERSFAWSSGGFVYTVVADAPAAVVSQVVAAMPNANRPGFWQRMAIGFRRLASWLNPLH
jgi:sigma-E factor negative regulatory protein RseB